MTRVMRLDIHLISGTASMKEKKKPKLHSTMSKTFSLFIMIAGGLYIMVVVLRHVCVLP